MTDSGTMAEFDAKLGELKALYHAATERDKENYARKLYALRASVPASDASRNGLERVLKVDWALAEGAPLGK
jgi:hypothetical protein